MLWSSTFSTPPRILSLDSVTDTVLRNKQKHSCYRGAPGVQTTYLDKGSDCLVPQNMFTFCTENCRHAFWLTYLYNDLQSIKNNYVGLGCKVTINKGFMFQLCSGPTNKKPDNTVMNDNTFTLRCWLLSLEYGFQSSKTAAESAVLFIYPYLHAL